MAYLVSVAAWNTATLDFNLAFSNSATTTSIPVTTLSSFGDLTIEGTVYAFAVQTQTITNQIDSLWPTGNSAQVLGSNLTTNPDGTILAGGVRGLALTLDDGFQYGITGFAIGGPRIGAAQATVSNTDDISAFNTIMTGNDLVFLSSLADEIVTGQGLDLVFAGAGDDTVSGAADNDVLLGQGGKDRLQGGLGKDAIFGGDDRDSVFGDDGVDTLAGGNGDDVLNGGLNRDFFVFDSDDGNDVVQDFTGTDRIVITDPTVEFSDLTITAVNATTTTIAFGATFITFQNAASTMFFASRFVFDGQATVDAGIATFMTGWDYFN